jgi:hypothetical protein
MTTEERIAEVQQALDRVRNEPTLFRRTLNAIDLVHKASILLAQVAAEYGHST